MPSGAAVDQVRDAISPEQADLGLTVAKDMDVRRLVIVDVDDDAQAFGTQHSDHDRKQPITMGCARPALSLQSHSSIILMRRRSTETAASRKSHMIDSRDTNTAAQHTGGQQTKPDRRRPGRLNNVDQSLVPLLRDPAGVEISDDELTFHEPPSTDLLAVAVTSEEDTLGVARGVAWGILLALPFWAAVAAFVYWIAR
jgi:hypothetical protein